MKGKVVVKGISENSCLYFFLKETTKEHLRVPPFGL